MRAPRTLEVASLADLRSSLPRKVHWTKDIAQNLPKVHYNAVMDSEAGVYEWLRRIVSRSLPLDTSREP